MKQISILILIVIMSSEIGSCQDEWEIVTLDSIGISAQVYRDSKMEADTLYLDKEMVFVKSWNREPESADHPVTEYTLNVSKYPSGYIHSDSSFQLVEGFLNSTANQLISDSNFEYVNSSLEFINGFPGKNFKFKNLESNELMDSKVYLVKSQLIEFVTNSLSKNWFSKSKNNFLESLKIDEKIQNRKDYGIPIIDEDSYTIDFPVEPEMSQMFIDTEEEIVHTKIKTLEKEASSGILVFMAGELKYGSKTILENEAREVFYDKSMNGSINSMNGQLVSKNQTYYKDIPGREYVSSLFDGKATSYTRIFYFNGTLYTQGVIYITEEINEAGRSFLSSFKIKIKN